ncbi:MAG: helicase [Paenibacillaceae bacterium]|jgi:DNA helicase-2/ATP-dependent DNA helicase PcrA|nr:helicase [Paenibacillaceae bacterium]
MNITPEQQRQELEHLSRVIREIEEQLGNSNTVIDTRRENVIDVRKMIWEEMRTDNANWANKIEAAGDIVMNSLELARIERGFLSAQAAARKLVLLRNSPYFARIDFLEDGASPAETGQIYIGLSTLLDENTMEPIVYDWRSPIASMFYDYSLGRARYPIQDGTVEGELLLKRQFRITGGKIQLMFDSGIRIGDDMLQFMLGQSTDEKMRSIVTTIQSEQNAVIRNEEYPILIVQGAAGSGKTSIALQRVAYLLYKYRRSIQADQMILFSPNSLFSDYISNVLPELGEDNMRQTTFQDFAEHRLSGYVQAEDRYTQMEEMLTDPEGTRLSGRAAGVAYKASKAFLEVIRNYLLLLSTEAMCFDPIPYGEQDWKSREQISELFYGRFGHHQIHVRLERIVEALREELAQLEDRQAKKLFRTMVNHPKYLGTDEELKVLSRKHVRRKIGIMADFMKQYRFINPVETYRRLFADPDLFRRVSEGTAPPEGVQWEAIRTFTLARLDSGIVPCEDVPPLLYLLETITGWNSFNSIRHVILDEAQDYSPFQYEIIRRLFPRSKLTLLGDLNQAIQPHMRIESYEFVEDLYGKEKTGIMRLTKSYRSTAEIVEFTKALLPGGEAIEAFSRNGGKPCLVQLHDEPAAKAKQIAQLLVTLRDQGAASIAVICKTAEESKEAYEALAAAAAPAQLHLVTKNETDFQNTLVVLPVYLAKGLEFDSVIIWDASAGVYGREEERKLFYTACTRAMNRLYVGYSGAVTEFVASVDPGLYDRQLQPIH